MGGAEVNDVTAPSALRGVRVSDADADAYAAAVWSTIVEPGDGVAGLLVQTLGAARALDRLRTERLPADIGLDRSQWNAALRRWAPRDDESAVRGALERARRGGIALVLPGDDAWPGRLTALGLHAPLALWVRGDPGVMSHPTTLSLVGARAATGYGESVAAELASDVARDGVVVVSGAAYGIDGAAHRGALAPGGRTVALLAGGVDRPYPSGHTELLDRIVRTGAAASEVPCGSTPTKWRFLARNRLIAALGDATVVVEAGARSGSLNTAAHAAQLGRPLGAVPGPVTSATSAGCHRVLRELGGVCVTSAGDVRELLGVRTADADELVDLGPASGAMTRLLDAASTRHARTIDELAHASGLDPADLEALIGLAVLRGDLVEDARGWRRRTTR